MRTEIKLFRPILNSAEIETFRTNPNFTSLISFAFEISFRSNTSYSVIRSKCQMHTKLFRQVLFAESLLVGERKMGKATKKEQYERMVELLHTNPNIAKGICKSGQDVQNRFWENLETELNSLGPPVKDPSAWKKVWFDYKSYIKKKLAHNKREQISTGGGPNKMHEFSPLEDQVISLTSIDKTIQGVINTASFGAPSRSNSLSTSLQNVSENLGTRSSYDMSSYDEQENNPCSSLDSQNESASCVNQRNTAKKETTFDLLKQQLKMQADFHESVKSALKDHNNNMKDIVGNARKIYKSIDSIAVIEKKKFEEMQRHNEKKEKLVLEKLLVKRRLLEIEPEKLDA